MSEKDKLCGRYLRTVMSAKEKLNQRSILNDALGYSFRKMLNLKMKLDQSVVTVDEKGQPITITAKEAEVRAFKRIFGKHP